MLQWRDQYFSARKRMPVASISGCGHFHNSSDVEILPSQYRTPQWMSYEVFSSRRIFCSWHGGWHSRKIQPEKPISPREKRPSLLWLCRCNHRLYLVHYRQKSCVRLFYLSVLAAISQRVLAIICSLQFPRSALSALPYSMVLLNFFQHQNNRTINFIKHILFF